MIIHETKTGSNLEYAVGVGDDIRNYWSIWLRKAEMIF
jgi:hypothetical protein